MNTHGVDISSYQGSPDHGAMATKAQFVIMRHSIGSLYDTQFNRNWAGLAGKTLRGMYYVPHPAVSGESAKAKLREMMEYKADFPIVLDIEIAGVYIDAVYGLAGYIYQKTGKYPMIYTSPGFWGSLWGKANKTHADFFVKCPLWVANYKVSKPGLVQPWGENWTIWQYGINSNKDDVEAYGLRYWESKAIDENWFNGDLMELYKFCEVGELEPPEEPPIVTPPVDRYVRVIAKQWDGKPGWLFFRQRPEFYAGDGLAVGYGVELKLLEHEPVNGLWHVTLDDFEGYVSAGKAYTKEV